MRTLNKKNGYTTYEKSGTQSTCNFKNGSGKL